MKTTLRPASVIAALGFALATLLQFTRLVDIPGIPTAGLVGGLVVSGLLVLVLGRLFPQAGVSGAPHLRRVDRRRTDREPPGRTGTGLDLHHADQVIVSAIVSGLRIVAQKSDGKSGRVGRTSSPPCWEKED